MMKVLTSRNTQKTMIGNNTDDYINKYFKFKLIQ